MKLGLDPPFFISTLSIESGSIGLDGSYGIEEALGVVARVDQGTLPLTLGKRGRASKQHMDAIRQMAEKSKSGKK